MISQPIHLLVFEWKRVNQRLPSTVKRKYSMSIINVFRLLYWHFHGNRISLVSAVVLSSIVIIVVVPLKSEVQDCVLLTVRESSQASI